MKYGFLISVVCVMGPASVHGAGPDAALLPPSAAPVATTTAPAPAATPAIVTTYRPFSVYSGRPEQVGHYVPSGYMGDLGSLSMSGAYVPTHDTKGTALRVVYKANGSKGWAGV